jgi:hypothetical protein
MRLRLWPKDKDGLLRVLSMANPPNGPWKPDTGITAKTVRELLSVMDGRLGARCPKRRAPRTNRKDQQGDPPIAACEQRRPEKVSRCLTPFLRPKRRPVRYPGDGQG